MNTENEIRKIVGEVLDVEEVQTVDIKQDLEKFGLDSVNYVKLIIALEDHYDILIPDEYLELTNIRSIYDICKLIAEVMQHE